MLILSTPYGNTYKIHDNGNIERLDMKFAPSGHWKFLGICHTKRNEFISFEKLKTMNLREFKWLYKNGHPQWTVKDLDHGSTRLWGNTHYHGIKVIYQEAE